MVHDFDPAIVSTPLGTAYWYGAVYTLGFLVLFLWLWVRRERIGLSAREAVLLPVMFAAGVMIGGRVFDILVYERDWYAAHPLAALNWWEGGMASHGVLLGGLAGTILFARTHGIAVLRLLDEIVVPGAVLMAVGRLGNFIEGGVVGGVTDMPWGFVYPDLEGARHPVALYESAKNFAIVPVLVWAQRRWPPGRGVVTALFVTLYAGLRFAVDTFRDYESAWLGLGTGQVFNLAMTAAGLLLLAVLLRRPARPQPRRVPPADGGPGLVLPLLLAALIVYPLGIPTSWTARNIAEKRAATLSEAAVAE